MTVTKILGQVDELGKLTFLPMVYLSAWFPKALASSCVRSARCRIGFLVSTRDLRFWRAAIAPDNEESWEEAANKQAA